MEREQRNPENKKQMGDRISEQLYINLRSLYLHNAQIYQMQKEVQRYLRQPYEVTVAKGERDVQRNWVEFWIINAINNNLIDPSENIAKLSSYHPEVPAMDEILDAYQNGNRKIRRGIVREYQIQPETIETLLRGKQIFDERNREENA